MWALNVCRVFGLIVFITLINCFGRLPVTADDDLGNDITDLDRSSEEGKVQLDSHATEQSIEVTQSYKTGNLSLEKLFNDAVESYLNEDWDGCIKNFEEAVKSYKEYKNSIVGCRRKCRTEANLAKPIFVEDIEDYHFYEKKVKETLCLMKCKKIFEHKDVKSKLLPIDVDVKYMERRPYEYLHICYYQMKRYRDAANAVFTFLAVHPNHEQGLKNIRFYLDLPEVVEEELLDVEADPFLSMYKAGLSAYNDENYSEVVQQLENSLQAYMRAEDDCRLYCEGPFDQGWLPDFTMSIANHFTYSLKCKRGCSYRLNNVNGEQRHELLLDHYHYLQFAYFQLGKLKKACAAIQSYLLFIPNDETIWRNKNYMTKLGNVSNEYFVPRKEASLYSKRQEYELRMLLYIQEAFNSV